MGQPLKNGAREKLFDIKQFLRPPPIICVRHGIMDEGCGVSMCTYSLCRATVIGAGGSGIPRSVRRVERQRTRNRSRCVFFGPASLICPAGAVSTLVVRVCVRRGMQRGGHAPS